MAGRDEDSKMRVVKGTLMMMVAEFVLAANSVGYKLAAFDGMKMTVLITYRFLFASILVFPFAFILERKKRPKLTWTILFQAFICTFLGGPLAQNLYAESLILTSATYATTFSNLIPAFTFLLALLFRLENVGIDRMAGKAKVIGTLVGVGGAMVLTFYKGHEIHTWTITHLKILHGGHDHLSSTHNTNMHHIIGSILALLNSLSLSLYVIFQAKMSANYPCHFSTTFLINVMGFIQSLVFTLCTERSWNQWKLSWNISLAVVLFMGISTVLQVLLMTVSIHLQGPLFVSAFTPLMLVYVAIAGFLLLDEKLHVGTVLGSVIIIAGLYMVLWGKSKDKRIPSKLTTSKSSENVNDDSTTTVPLETMRNMADPLFSPTTKGNELRMKSTRERQNEQGMVEEA